MHTSRGRGQGWKGAQWLGAALLFATLSVASTAAAQGTTATGVVVVQAPPQQVQYAPVVQYQQPYAPAYTEAPAPRRRGGANIGLIVSGSVLLGVGWITNFISGLPAGDDPFRSGGSGPEWQTFRYTSLIPIAGPWVQLAVKPTGFDDDYWGLWLILNGLLQAAGTTLLIAGIATSTDEETTADAGGVQWVLMPSASPEHVGLSLAGRF